MPPPPVRSAGFNITATEPEPEAPSEAEEATMPTEPAVEPAAESRPSRRSGSRSRPTSLPARPRRSRNRRRPRRNTPSEEAKTLEIGEETEPKQPADKPEQKAGRRSCGKGRSEGRDAGGQARPETPGPLRRDEAKPDAAPPAATTAPAAGDRVVTGDWPCWGGSIHRNMVNATTKIAIDFEPAEIPQEGKKLLWVAKLGSQTYGNPVVSGGKVWVGTNNGGEYRPKHKGDRGCVLCFDEKTGKFLWQLTREKLPQGRVNDWPEQGICSTPFVDGDRMWVVSNRAELMCLDTEGFYDKENDGPYTTEVDTEELDADIVWSLDMIEKMGVFPHNLATSSPVVVRRPGLHRHLQRRRRSAPGSFPRPARRPSSR